MCPCSKSLDFSAKLASSLLLGQCGNAAPRTSPRPRRRRVRPPTDDPGPRDTGNSPRPLHATTDAGRVAYVVVGNGDPAPRRRTEAQAVAPIAEPSVPA